MRLRISLALMGFACLSGLRAADVGPEVLSRSTIYSVLDRHDAYLASTTSGLYEASASDHVWKKLPETMPADGRLAQRSPTSPEIAYYLGWLWIEREGMDGSRPKDTGLYLSPDGGVTWRKTLLDEPIVDVYLNPDGAIYVVDEAADTKPLPGQSAADWQSTTGDGVKHYAAQHLMVSRDAGWSWTDITPKLNPHFGMYGIMQDPDNPTLVDVQSAEIGHMSWSFYYKARDVSYTNWTEIRSDQWPVKNRNSDFIFNHPESQTALSSTNMPANLDNFFKFPYPRSGHNPDLPTSFLIAEKSAYTFHLHQPMPVQVSTFFMYADPPVKIIDNSDATVFWGLKILPKDGELFFANPKTSELSGAIPDRDAKPAAYLHDPHLFTVEADQAHPYEREIDLNQLNNFTKPGEYRIAIFIDTITFDRTSGRALGTLGIDVTILP
jgi:hypothetical protein